MVTLILGSFALVGLVALIGVVYLWLSGGDDNRRGDRD